VFGEAVRALADVDKGTDVIIRKSPVSTSRRSASRCQEGRSRDHSSVTVSSQHQLMTSAHCCVVALQAGYSAIRS
jgi:hypothetical protein